MYMKFIILAAIVAYASAQLYGGHGHEIIKDYYAPAQYEFKYGVSDHHTGDEKEQSEVRHGDVVKGQYSLREPDGTIRIVKYTADKHNGFNAIVERKGHAVHPQIIHKVVQPVVHKVITPVVAHAAPVALSLGGHGGGVSYSSIGLGLH